MGLFIYANSTPGVEFDDRALTHLKIVIFAKLRRNEAFGFSWTHAESLGGARGAVWLSSSVPLQFVFFGSRPPNLNRTWLASLTQTANSSTGLLLLPEPTDTWAGDLIH